MRVLFEASLLSCQGQIVVVDDYAHFNKEFFGNESFVISRTQNFLSRMNSQFRHEDIAVNLFRDKYDVSFYNNYDEFSKFVDDNRIDLVYMVTGGEVFNKEQTKRLNAKTAVHAVFDCVVPVGDSFAYVSEWLSKTAHDGKYPFVPHMVNLPNTQEDLREKLNIPKDATVFGRHGSRTTFNIPFAHEVVNRIVQEREDVYFIFLNTDNVCENFNHRKLINHERIINLSATLDRVEKTKFINTCDAMLHARINGESFGLAIAEFSVKNKPIITWSFDGVEKYYKHKYDTAHIEILGDKGIYYKNYDELYYILKHFYTQPNNDWDAYSEKYNPKVVMDKFKKIFID